MITPFHKLDNAQLLNYVHLFDPQIDTEDSNWEADHKSLLDDIIAHESLIF